ncbi:SPFH domain-containing protein [Nonomuraea roseoviolacea]|uniref:Regulator of protease activity HflC (Stomatin/prohibitin superfamily) n=1 Tax=Nonomuraea roseoviolacea subsp. carminata TaxID=160689 RepID=A0ABT1K8W8_9ACTN|nr:SPFH domain-containing protein [Nonomuraea roseoviolacea]MCP2350450.1 regulator of protease activity HflC (stomatin/prohibitin superfamily) [Nonomuraea roseoviolacea subsp. carminata]
MRTALLVIATILSVPALIGLVTGLERTDGGEVAVVRDGGPFDDNKVRQVIDPASGLTWTGWWSSTHGYPAQQRFYTITADPRRATTLGVDVVTVPSSDGVNLGIEGTLYFTLNLDHETLKTFDDKYGTRTFRAQGDAALYPWEGDEGWSAFFGQAVRPVIDNALRSEIGAMRCGELVPSCSLLESTALRPQSSNTNLVKVQNAVNATLARELPGTLGGDFLTGLRFTLARVTLPAEVQKAVDRSLSAGAAVSEAQAKVEQAKAEAAANRARQEGYDKCPACAEIEKLRSLPQGITVYAPGNPQSVVVPAR